LVLFEIYLVTLQLRLVVLEFLLVLIELLFEINTFLRRKILRGYFWMEESFLFIEVIDVAEFLFEDNQILLGQLFVILVY